jgi:hypothetical protein
LFWLLAVQTNNLAWSVVGVSIDCYGNGLTGLVGRNNGKLDNFAGCVSLFTRDGRGFGIAWTLEHGTGSGFHVVVCGFGYWDRRGVELVGLVFEKLRTKRFLFWKQRQQIFIFAVVRSKSCASKKCAFDVFEFCLDQSLQTFFVKQIFL